LLLGFLVDGFVVEVLSPVDGDFGPDEDAKAIGGAGHALVVGIVGEADVVGVEFLDPGEEGVDVLLVVDAAGAEGCFSVDADAVEGDGLAVE
jgi:hypothetical protein